ncbi:hypothetical protein O9K51_04710 [Purpureocillium lavendulum]|uniref:Uncharacterized protein n=1 Tax=Purpureocillium lavendulum TaxID=1247861 RepID=A0AB34FYW1_9HYPO|nr:hypothetical protein O9K51_04710 [Purpureocillium lavendulum]
MYFVLSVLSPLRPRGTERAHCPVDPVLDAALSGRGGGIGTALGGGSSRCMAMPPSMRRLGVGGDGTHHGLVVVVDAAVDLLLGGPALELLLAVLLGDVDDVVVAAPVGVVVLELGHGHALPEAHLLAGGDGVDAGGPAGLVLVPAAAEAAQRVVCGAGVGLHLPHLLAQTAVLAAGLVELGAVGAVPGGHVGDVLGLVLVELAQHEGEGAGVLGEEARVLVARVVGLFESLGEDGDEGVEVLAVDCACGEEVSGGLVEGGGGSQRNEARGRTLEVVGGGAHQVIVGEALGAGAGAHPAEPADNILGDASVVGELAAQLLDHAVDVVELGLVAGGRGRRSRHGGHVGAVDAVHGCVLRLRLRLLLLLLLLRAVLLILRLLLLGRGGVGEGGLLVELLGRTRMLLLRRRRGRLRVPLLLLLRLKVLLDLVLLLLLEVLVLRRRLMAREDGGVGKVDVWRGLATMVELLLLAVLLPLLLLLVEVGLLVVAQLEGSGSSCSLRRRLLRLRLGARRSSALALASLTRVAV